MKQSCVVLWSGGIDSTVCLFWATKRFKEVTAFSIDYGQKNPYEILCSHRVKDKLKLKEHMFYTCGPGVFSGSSLTDDNLEIPKHGSDGVPNTFVPGRNLLFLVSAASYGFPRKIYDIVIGTNVIDYSHYYDCREGFLVAAEKAISLALGSKIKIHYPLQYLSKKEIVQMGFELGVPFEYTISCYESEIPCFVPKNSKDLPLERIQRISYGCESCMIRNKAFNELGKIDPLLVRLRKEGRI